MAEDIPEQLAEHRTALIASSLDVCAEPQVDTTYLTYGMSTLYVSIQAPENQPVVCSFGESEGTWGPESFMDGSCYHSSVPEVARAGWAVFQICNSLLPARAKYGALPRS